MAVADAAQDDKLRPPNEVTMAGRIEQWGDPWGGGWMAWPAGLITKLTIARNITNAFQSLARASGGFGEWEKSHPFEAKIYWDIYDLYVARDAANG